MENPPSLTTPPSQSSLDSFSLTPLTTFPSSFFPPLFPALLWENQTSQTYFSGCSSDDSPVVCLPLASEREGPLLFFLATAGLAATSAAVSERAWRPGEAREEEPRVCWYEGGKREDELCN